MIYLFLFILLFLLQLLYFRLADRYNIIDKPNERSSHTAITLRGGGVIFYLAMVIYLVAYGFQFPWFFAGLSLIAFMSFADDVRPQKSSVRLIIHFISMMLMFYQLNVFTLPWYYTIVSLILCTGIINAYNFMDGINGITGAYSVTVLVSLWYINNFVQPFFDNAFIYVLFLALLVFNFFNFRKKAKCFAGDVGSVSMAFIIVFLLGKLIIYTGNLWYILLLGIYGVDVILTIIHRLFLKENILKPHRKHAYQIMANELKIPHLIVSLFYGGAQLLLSVLTIYIPWAALLLLIVFVAGYILFKKKYYHLHKI